MVHDNARCVPFIIITGTDISRTAGEISYDSFIEGGTRDELPIHMPEIRGEYVQG